jgi:hypothetical protein
MAQPFRMHGWNAPEQSGLTRSSDIIADMYIEGRKRRLQAAFFVLDGRESRFGGSGPL